MKKSIYKVTFWSIIITVVIIISQTKSIKAIKPIDQYSNGLNNGIIEETLQNEYSVSDNEYSTALNSFGTNDATANTKIRESNSQSVHYEATASKNLENKFSDKDLVNNIETATTATNEDAFLKSGPNNNESLQGQFYNEVIATNNAPLNAVSPSGNVSNPSVSNAINVPTSNNQNITRVSAPAIVTAPPSPSGGNSGGSGAGDPFVPLDDYFGLIFLIFTATIVGLHSIKKNKIF